MENSEEKNPQLPPQPPRKLPKGWGLVQYLACREDIATMVSKGFSCAMIHRTLKEAGKITMSELQLWRYMSGQAGAKKKRRRPHLQASSPSQASLKSAGPTSQALPAPKPSTPLVIPAMCGPVSIRHDNDPLAEQVVFGIEEKNEQSENTREKD